MGRPMLDQDNLDSKRHSRAISQQITELTPSHNNMRGTFRDTVHEPMMEYEEGDHHHRDLIHSNDVNIEIISSENSMIKMRFQVEYADQQEMYNETPQSQTSIRKSLAKHIIQSAGCFEYAPHNQDDDDQLPYQLNPQVEYNQSLNSSRMS